MFQSTPPRRGRPERCLPAVWQDKVSIHAPAQGATIVTVMLLTGCMFQSTPPRRGRQGGRRYDLQLQPVSIHAPAQEATVALTLVCCQ